MEIFGPIVDAGEIGAAIGDTAQPDHRDVEAMRGAQDMQDTDLRAAAPTHLNPINTVTDNHIRNCSFPGQQTFGQLPATTAFASVSRGIAPGSSLDMTKTRVHEYAVYGWCDRNRNLVMVEVGYRKAFK